MTRQIPAIPDPASATEVASARSVRVMLVDDSLVVRSILERIVEQRPELKICASVASAREALDYLAYETVDVVVLDIEMPGMNGMDAMPHLIEPETHARVLIPSSNRR